MKKLTLIAYWACSAILFSSLIGIVVCTWLTVPHMNEPSMPTSVACGIACLVTCVIFLILTIQLSDHISKTKNNHDQRS